MLVALLVLFERKSDKFGNREFMRNIAGALMSDRLDRIRSRIFRQACSIQSKSSQRTGVRVLMAPGGLKGPALKSYWPNVVLDLSSPWNRPASGEIPLIGAGMAARQYASDLRRLPVSLLHVYRENIADWRRKRGGNVRKGNKAFSNLNNYNTIGETKIVSTMKK